ncbi:protein of unknown function (plasmid) [Cupriavidus taiwanensis]|nr:protein of unknown function [Cupriavidus taiwanensis]SOZ43333.1 protein of unknown function [Cupriavidus taiwanensis]SPD54087.1 protein of unknown function [Cupriavidus taiwanensis]
MEQAGRNGRAGPDRACRFRRLRRRRRQPAGGAARAGPRPGAGAGHAQRRDGGRHPVRPRQRRAEAGMAARDRLGRAHRHAGLPGADHALPPGIGPRQRRAQRRWLRHQRHQERGLARRRRRRLPADRAHRGQQRHRTVPGAARQQGPDGDRLPDHRWPARRRPVAAERHRAGQRAGGTARRRPGGTRRRPGTRHRRAVRRGRRRDGKADPDHRRIPGHAPAVRQAAGQLPGAAAPHGRHAGAEGTGAVDGLRRRAGAGRNRPRRAPPHAVRRQGHGGPRRPLRRPAGRAVARRHGHDRRAVRGRLFQAPDHAGPAAGRQRLPPAALRRSDGSLMPAATGRKVALRPGKDPASLFGSAEFPGDDAGAHPLMRYFVDAPARSPAPLPQAEEKTSGRGKSRSIASDNACERSDALRARAADLRW